MDLTGLGLVKDTVDSLFTGSPKPLFNSGNKLNDAGNAVDVADKSASALAKTLPAAGKVGQFLGPAGRAITVAKTAKGYIDCVI